MKATTRKLAKQVEQSLDDAVEDSFPASDPVSFLQPFPVKKGDQKLCTVKINNGAATSRKAQPAAQLGRKQ